MSFPTKINEQSLPRLCGSGGRAIWEAVHAFSENIMFLNTRGWSMMESDDGK